MVQVVLLDFFIHDSSRSEDPYQICGALGVERAFLQNRGGRYTASLEKLYLTGGTVRQACVTNRGGRLARTPSSELLK